MKKYKEKVKKYRVLIIMISVFVVIGIIVYNLQFVIFRSLYESNNNVAKKVYSINNNNKKFKDSVNIMFSEETEEYINKYKNNEISYEELNEYVNKISEYKDYNGKLQEVKEQKEKYELAEKYIGQKNYKEALPIYIELNDVNYVDLTEKITETKRELKQSILKKVNQLKQEKNYISAEKMLAEVEKFYNDDKEFLDLLSETKKLKQTQENAEKEKKQIEEIKASVKVTKIWASTPNSAGGVDLYINWKNLSNKIIKYAYFTVVPYNSVNDIVNCTIRRYSKFTAQDEGPYSKGQGTQGTGYYWENAWYNYSIKSVKLESVRIEYMDGTSLDIPEKYINYIK